MTDKTNIPIPATVADSGPFKIIDGSNDGKFYCVFPDKNNTGQLSVPLGDGPNQVAIRLHEYGHLMLVSLGFHKANLPQTVIDKNIDGSWFQTCLDVIVNSFLVKRDCEEISDLPLTIPDKKHHVLASVAQIFLKSAGLKLEKQIKLETIKILSKNDIAILETARKKLGQWSQEDKLPIIDFFKLIEELEKRFGSLYNYMANWGEIISAENAEVAYGDYDDDDVYETKIKNAPSEILDDFIKPENTRKDQKLIAKKLGTNLDCYDWNRWGNMEVTHLPLTKIHPTRKNARKFRPGFVGAFRYPHRALIPASDGSAFAYRQKAKGGTMLLDCSGSMGLSLKAIGHLLDYAPMLIVAGYAGNQCDNNYYSCKSGSLAIFLKDGLLASKSSIREWHKERNGGNVVDGPALRWLIKQPKPHIWISDGMVSGIDDSYSENLEIEVKILQKLGNIKRYLNIHNCLKEFKTTST